MALNLTAFEKTKSTSSGTSNLNLSSFGVKSSTKKPDKTAQFQAEAKIAKEESDKANSFKGILKNTIKGIPRAVVDIYKPLVVDTGNVLKEIAQGTARTVATVGMTAGNIPTQIANNLILKNNPQPLPFDDEIAVAGSGKFAETIFGKDKSIRTFSGAKANVQKVIEPYVGKTSSNILSAPLVLGSIFMDLSGTGGAAKKGLAAVAQTIAKTKNVDTVFNALKPFFKGDEMYLREIATKLTSINDAAKVEKALTSLEAASKAKNAVKVTVKEAETLATQAKKYKSVDEFVSAAQFGKVKDAPLMNQKEKLTEIWNKAVGKDSLYHGTPSGKLSLDDLGNINLGTKADEVGQFAGQGGKVIEIPINKFKIKDFSTKDEMFDAVGKDKQKYLDEGYDIIRADNHAIAINPEKVAKVTKTEVSIPFRDRKIADFITEKGIEIPDGLPKIKAKEVPEAITNKQKAVDEERMMVEIQKDVIERDPAKNLEKYYDSKLGGLPEPVLTKYQQEHPRARVSRWRKEGDVLSDIFGFKDSEDARDSFELYMKKKQGFREQVRALRASEKELAVAIRENKSQGIIDNMMDDLGKHQEKMIDFAEKNPELAKLLSPMTKEMEKGAIKGYKLGVSVGGREAKISVLEKLRHATEASQGIKNDIVAIAKTLPSAERGKALVLVRDAKTPRDLAKAFSRINKWADDAEKKAVRNDILKTQKQIMDSPSIAIDYKGRIKELMGDFELKGHRESTLERLKKTQEFLQSEIAAGKDVEIPRQVLKSLELLNRTPFDEITINQLTGLKAEMELLENIGRTKFKTADAVWEIKKTKILDEIKTQGAKPLQEIELIKPEIGERLTATQKFKNLIWRAGNEAARIDRAIAPMDTMFDLLDGGKATYNGANFKFFKGQVDSGYGRYISRKDALQKPVFDLEAKYKFDDTNYERIGVVAAREQDGGVDKLLGSGFTKEQIDAVKLTDPEREMLDLMRNTFDSQFPEIQDVMRRVYNQPVEKVKNYFSFMTDWKAMDDSEVFQRFGSQQPEQFGMPKKNVEAGFTKSRVGGNQKIKINAMDVFTQHTDNTSYLLELGETSKMLGEVAASPAYAEAVGDVGQLMVREWLDVIARKGGAAGASEIAILNTLRKNVGIGILGLKLSTVAIQPTALIDGMGFIGTKYGAKGAKNFITDTQWRKFVSKMPEISDRMGGEFALRELTDENWLQKIQQKGFVPMQKLDQMTAGSIAAGAYERKMIELGLPIDLNGAFNKEALDYAQLAVRRTQSSGAFKDVPLAISRGALTGNRSLDRAMLQFQNFLLNRWSRIRHDAFRAGINTKDPKKAIPIFTALIMSALAAAGIRLGVNKVQDFITGKEDEDTPAEDIKKSFIFEMTGNVPFVGTALSMAMYDGEMFPILDAPKGIVSGLNRVITSESEAAKLRGLTEFAGSLGALLGVPGSAQTEQLVRGALQDEKAEPKEKKLKAPPGLPELPSLTKTLPTPPGLPKLPSL